MSFADWKEAVEYGEETIRIIDEEVPSGALEKADEFFTDVLEKTASVIETIADYEDCTERQESALRGWRAGVEKWIR